MGCLFCVGVYYPDFTVCLYLHNSLENEGNYHILDILGHGSKCLDIMGLDLLGLDILGISWCERPKN